jgi:hypothetical protein
MVWRYFIETFTPTVTTYSQMSNILKTKNTHKQEPVETVKIQIQEVRNEFKRMASNDFHERHRKIMHKDMHCSN